MTKPRHAIDPTRTIVHDNDRGGDYYSTWCVCGSKLTSAVPHWRDVLDTVERHRLASRRGKRRAAAQ